MGLFTAKRSTISEAELDALLAAAQGASDRRVDPRHAFFTTVTLRPSTLPNSVISAFSREISRSGIGLLHGAPIYSDECYEIDIRIEQVHVRRNARVVWCRKVGDAWYLSGCRFV